MTEEERRKLLCDALRNGHPSRSMCQEAAKEIEQLAALVQSGADGRKKGRSRLVYDKEKRTIVPKPNLDATGAGND